eukprot:TRINITY_DN157077_c0_g1_i1.p1 TRINITY_DN157077_c0_g1~~TRINITY_DN157077_c0_g1_i1.p1  ORF type:complete len:108 (-),score=29.20 TRINITY_DN157077_c0_g1_i1:96-419(-)
MSIPISTSEARGAVEKWLLQVEDMMIMSVRKVVLDSIQAYRDSPRDRWVIEWPGQVILCVSTIFWTSEVMEAMSQKDGLQVSGRLVWGWRMVLGWKQSNQANFVAGL